MWNLSIYGFWFRSEEEKPKTWFIVHTRSLYVMGFISFHSCSFLNLQYSRKTSAAFRVKVEGFWTKSPSISSALFSSSCLPVLAKSCSESVETNRLNARLKLSFYQQAATCETFFSKLVQPTWQTLILASAAWERVFLRLRTFFQYGRGGFFFRCYLSGRRVFTNSCTCKSILLVNVNELGSWLIQQNHFCFELLLRKTK